MTGPTASPGRPVDAARRTIRAARSVAGPALTVVLALGLAACGDDDTAGADGAPAAAGETAGADAFCDAALTLETTPGPDVDFAQATGEQIAEAARVWGTDVLRPLADEVAAAAPAAIDAEIEVLSAVVDEVAETGDISAFDVPEATAANDAYMDFVVAECGWDDVEVGAVDYRFEGMPAELGTGPTRLVFSNQGNELHELLLLRRNEGTDQPVEELLSLSEEQASQLVTPVGEPAFAPPGGSEQVVLDLDPGNYIAVCFIPTGTTSEDAGPRPDAPPHAVHGMVTEFTVSD